MPLGSEKERHARQIWSRINHVVILMQCLLLMAIECRYSIHVIVYGPLFSFLLLVQNNTCRCSFSNVWQPQAAQCRLDYDNDDASTLRLSRIKTH